MRYWDSSCFLAWLKEEPDKTSVCRGAIKEAENGNIQIATSSLTIAEVLYIKHSPPIPVTEAEKVRKFFENDYIILVNLDREIACNARELVWEHGVRPKDAIHVASALYVKTETLDTFDEGLIDLNGRIGNPPLRMGRPDIPYQEELPNL